MEHQKPLASLHSVSVFSGTKAILADITLEVAAHEILTIIGPNGAGKTTLIRVLLGLKAPSQGQVFRREDLMIGYVPQRFRVPELLPLPVKEFLRLGAAATVQWEFYLEMVGLPASIQHTQLQDLSGGELQRVLLARALLRKPNWLVLDEPTQGVDVAGQSAFYALLTQIHAETKVAVLLVSHDLHYVMATAQKVICINGHICCSGKPEVVAHDPAFVAMYQHHHNHTHAPGASHVSS